MFAIAKKIPAGLCLCLPPTLNGSAGKLDEFAQFDELMCDVSVFNRMFESVLYLYEGN